MKRLTGIIAAALLAFSSVAYADGLSGYVPVDELAFRFSLSSLSINEVSGNRQFSNRVNSLVVTPGMARVLVNGRVVDIDGIPKFINGRLCVSGSTSYMLESEFRVSDQPQAESHFKKVVIDPGHGGKFTGAEGPTGVLEKNINLQVSLKLKRMLEENGIEVVMTRETDKHLDSSLRKDLKIRTEIANREKPDLFISMHSNSSESRAASGFEVYYSKDPNIDSKIGAMIKNEIPGESAGDEISESTGDIKKIVAEILLEEYYLESRKMAQCLHAAMKESLPSKDRGVKTADFYVIKWTNVPAVLIEMDFVSNREYEKKLASSDYQEKIAKALTKGILEYKKQFDSTRRFTFTSPSP